MSTQQEGLKVLFYIIQGGRCAAPCDFFTEGLGKCLPIDDLQWDHIHAESKGGPNTIINAQLLCGNCNKIKGDRSMQFLLNDLWIRKVIWIGAMMELLRD